MAKHPDGGDPKHIERAPQGTMSLEPSHDRAAAEKG